MQLSINNVSMRFGALVLFEDVNTTFISGRRYAITGPNGAGKSTLMKIMTGEIDPEKGSVTRVKKMGVLKQDQFAFDEFRVMDTVIMGNSVLWEALQERELLYAKDPNGLTDQDGMRLGELEGIVGDEGGYTAEVDAAILLDGLDIPEELHNREMSALQGGQKVRVLLAQALFGNPDILLLDEPTNNLDLETIGWLENFLADYENIVLVVSHDRHFLDAVCSHVADIDYGKIQIFTGNYTFWYESSQLMARQIGDKNKKTEEKRQALIDFIARFSANASKSRQATARKKALEKLTIEEIEPSNRKYPGIIFQPLREVGNQILNVENLSSAIEGRKLFSKVSFSINKGEKIAFLSKDPLAVTNFFEIINGNMEADGGKFEWGTTITKAYLPVENNGFFNNGLNLMEWLRQYVPPHVTDADEPFLRGFLGKMLFSGDDINKKTNVLSGGEKVRCMISRMMLQNPNVVVLDQPTNHLDLESIQAFNDGCQMFPGIVLLTSHDHTFMQTVANRVIELTPSGIIDRLMTFDEYLTDKRVKELRETMYAGKGAVLA